MPKNLRGLKGCFLSFFFDNVIRIIRLIFFDIFSWKSLIKLHKIALLIFGCFQLEKDSFVFSLFDFVGGFRIKTPFCRKIFFFEYFGTEILRSTYIFSSFDRCADSCRSRWCVLDIDECIAEPCNTINHGVCHNLIGSFECLCVDGYSFNETTQTCYG